MMMTMEAKKSETKMIIYTESRNSLFKAKYFLYLENYLHLRLEYRIIRHSPLIITILAVVPEVLWFPICVRGHVSDNY